MEKVIFDETKFPLDVDVYFGDNKFLIVPMGYSKTPFGYALVDNTISITENSELLLIGQSIITSLAIIKNSTYIEGESLDKKFWQVFTKYKSWKSFWKNFHLVSVYQRETGDYRILSAEKEPRYGGIYNGCIKEIELPSTASAEDIGKAVVDVLEKAKDYYADNSAD